MKAKEFAAIPDEDENLRRMLKTPPKPHAPLKSRKGKASRAKDRRPKRDKTTTTN
jgi:hypothetical protein